MRSSGFIAALTATVTACGPEAPGTAARPPPAAARRIGRRRSRRARRLAPDQPHARRQSLFAARRDHCRQRLGLEVVLDYQLGNNSTAVPIVVGGVMYVPSRDRVVALDGDTGAEVWATRCRLPRRRRRGAPPPARAGRRPAHGLDARRQLLAGRRLGRAADLVHEPRELDRGRRRDRRPRRGFGTTGMVDVGVPTAARRPSTQRRDHRRGERRSASRPPRQSARVRRAHRCEALGIPDRAEEPASRSTRLGGTAGRTAAARTCGRSRHRSTPSAASRICRSRAPPRTTTAAIAPARTCSRNSIVAVEATTGKYLWHFQTVHHDLWDIDMPSAGSLFDFVRHGERVPAIAPSRQVELFLRADRVTGKPLIEVEEQPVPKGDVPPSTTRRRSRSRCARRRSRA